jgi:hypothetical protein
LVRSIRLGCCSKTEFSDRDTSGGTSYAICCQEKLGTLMADKDPDVLRPRLDRAEHALKHALSEVCHADVGAANTGELIRLEEVLAIANEAAKEAVSVRRRLRHDPVADEAGRAAGDAPAGPGANREFDDALGVRWIVFAVYPSSERVARAGLRAQFQDGWLAFDSGVETRRLAPIPSDWLDFSDAALEEACARAEVAPKRQPRAR